MDANTLISSLTLFVTTTMSITASVFIAYYTFRRQSTKDLSSLNRIRQINRDTAIELFHAQIASLMFFLPEGNPDFHKQTLSLYCQKLDVIEQYLADLKDSDLPDSFIPQFQYYRLICSLTKTTIKHRIECCTSNILPADSFDDLEIQNLIRDLHSFTLISQNA